MNTRERGHIVEVPVLEDPGPDLSVWFSSATCEQIQSLFLSKSVDELLKLDIFPNIYERGLEPLRRYGTILYPEMSAEGIKTLLDEFLFGNPSTTGLSGLLHKSPDLFWRHAHLNEKWRTFAKLALRFISLPTSEADVKRLSSVQKSTMGLYANNMGSETLEAPLRMRQSHDQ